MELPQVPPEPQEPPPPRCIHLHSKSLSVHGEGYAGARDRGDVEDMSDCWCIMTGRALGPDDMPAGLRACSDPDRDCYREY